MGKLMIFFHIAQNGGHFGVLVKVFLGCLNFLVQFWNWNNTRCFGQIIKFENINFSLKISFKKIIMFQIFLVVLVIYVAQ
jgi:hypothetical protein